LAIAQVEESRMKNIPSVNSWSEVIAQPDSVNHVQITHRYTRRRDIYGVSTTKTLEELNQICAYFQVVWDSLPDLPCCEDVIGETEAVLLLTQYYDCKPIFTIFEIESGQEIDLYLNWNNYACGASFDDLHRKFGSDEVVTAIVDLMIADATASSSSSRPETLKILYLLRDRKPLPDELNLKRLSGEPFVNFLCRDEVDNSS
jgi:hypothetical protein